MQEKVTFENSKGDKLVGILSDPTGDKSRPLLISCHGMRSGKNNKTILNLEKILNEHNLPVFRFDFYGHYESEGDIEKMTFDEWVDDIISAHKFLADRGYSKFGLFGSSFGGAAVVVAAKNLDVLCLVLKSPGMGQTSKENPLYKKDFEEGVWFEAGKQVSCSTLIVHGDADTDVELEQGKKLANSIENCRLEIIKGADHGYSKLEDFEKMVKLIVDFIVEKSKS